MTKQKYFSRHEVLLVINISAFSLLCRSPLKAYGFNALQSDSTMVLGASNGNYCNYCSKYNSVSLQKQMQVTGLQNLIFIANHSSGKHGYKFISFPSFLEENSKRKGRGKELQIFPGNYSILLSCCCVFYLTSQLQTYRWPRNG